MPAVSEKQRRAAGMALAAKRGRTPVSHLVGAAKQMHDAMTEKQLEDFATTKSNGLRLSLPAAAYTGFKLSPTGFKLSPGAGFTKEEQLRSAAIMRHTMRLITKALS